MFYLLCSTNERIKENRSNFSIQDQITGQSLHQILINQWLIEELIFANSINISLCDFQHD